MIHQPCGAASAPAPDPYLPAHLPLPYRYRCPGPCHFSCPLPLPLFPCCTSCLPYSSLSLSATGPPLAPLLQAASSVPQSIDQELQSVSVTTGPAPKQHPASADQAGGARPLQGDTTLNGTTSTEEEDASELYTLRCCHDFFAVCPSHAHPHSHSLPQFHAPKFLLSFICGSPLPSSASSCPSPSLSYVPYPSPSPIPVYCFTVSVV